MLRSIALGVCVCLFAAVVAAPHAVRAADAKVVLLRGAITSDTVLKRKRTYVLQGLVFVRGGATLKIKAGTTVFCDQGSMLVVERGARIVALGTAEQPVVFTSAQPERDRRRGDWGGVVVNGYAPVAVPGGVATGEGGTGQYGGDDPDDDSGTLRYVRIEYAGYPIGAEGRSDALALRGAGAGTTIEFVEALNGDGDGIAVSGGTVSLRYAASIGNARNGMAWSKGWTGEAQFLLVQQRRDVGRSPYDGIHADASAPKVSNATIVGSTTGIRLGAGARGAYRNVVVTGCAGDGLATRDAGTLEALAERQLEVSHAIFYDNRGGANFGDEVRTALVASASPVVERDPLLVNGLDEATPVFRPLGGSPALDLVNVAPVPFGAFFRPADYLGAFGGEEGGDWLVGWTNFETPPDPRYLANASPSPEQLSRRFLAALADSDTTALKPLRITKKEFCWYVWPELPASQLPNVSCDFAWSQATLNSLAGLSEVLSTYAGRRFEFVSLRFAGGSEVHQTYTVHYDTRLTVRDEQGTERELKLFGSMLEQNGQFKLFSFVVD